MDIRIGITHAPREISIEIEDDETAVNQIKALAEAALSGMSTTFTVTDRRGRQVVVPSAKIAYVEFGAPDGDRKLGFGS
ncbi:MAG: DUF3107 domain-containing protein [Ilumatobacteraceae bacterium]